jgi:DNA-binding transcriptional MerR regulator
MRTFDPKHDRIVRPKEAAAILGVSASTLRRLELRGQLAPRRAVSANVRGFLLSEIISFLDGSPASEAATS